MPISCVRCATACAVTAYSPTDARQNAISAIVVNRLPPRRGFQPASSITCAIVLTRYTGRSGSSARTSARSSGASASGDVALRTMMAADAGGSAPSGR